MLLPVLFAALFFCPKLVESNNSFETKPVRLTGDNSGKVSIPYFANDQCKPHFHSRLDDNARRFGLWFQLPPEMEGYCDEGLLICYPGTLMRHFTSGTNQKHVTGFKVKRGFQVNNAQNNSVSLACAEQLKNISTDGQHWRGIRVYTKRTSAELFAESELILETSLTSRSYSFGNGTRQLSLKFGTDLFTFVEIDNGEPFNEDELKIKGQYVAQFGMGTYMADHTGLWMLGLDMLAWKEEEHVDLYIYRTCSCTMEAWFTRPTDSKDPDTIMLPTAGSKECPVKETEQFFELTTLNSVKEKHLEARLVITALTDAEWDKISVKLIRLEKDQTPTRIMNFTIGTTENMTVSFPDKYPTVANNSITRLPNGTHKFHLEICLMKHWYGIKVNGTQIGKAYWPNEWWKVASWKNITSLQLSGKMLLLYDIRPINTGNSCDNLTSSVNLPITLSIDDTFRINSHFIFRFQPTGTSSDNNTISITFAEVKEEKTENSRSRSDSKFAIQIKDLNTVALNVYYGGQWHPDQQNKTNFPFNKTDVFELYFGITDKSYLIKVNGEDLFTDYTNQLPYCKIKYVRLEGDAELLDFEKNALSSLPQEGNFVSKALEKMPNYGDIISITTDEMPSGTVITVKLMHNSRQCSKIYTIVVQFDFQVADMAMAAEYRCYHKLNEGNLVPSKDANYSLFIAPNTLQKLEILLTNVGFYGRASLLQYKTYWYKLCSYYVPKNYPDYPVFPWAVNQIEITSSMQTVSFNVTVETAEPNDRTLGLKRGFKPNGIQWTRINYTQIVALENKMIDYRVNVNITLSKPLSFDSYVFIHFFNDALQIHPLFGSTVMFLRVYNGLMSFYSIPIGEWRNHTQPSRDTFYIQNMLENAQPRLSFFNGPRKSFETIQHYEKRQVPNSETTTTTTTTTPNPIISKPASIFMNFTFHVTNAAGHVGFDVSLNGRTYDDRNVTMFYAPDTMSLNDIQYVTIEHSCDAAVDTVEINCHPETRCEPNRYQSKSLKNCKSH